MAILKMLGLSPSKDDEKLKALVNNSYASVRVVGRGTVKIDPVEVRQSKEFQEALEQAKAIRVRVRAKSDASRETGKQPSSPPEARAAG